MMENSNFSRYRNIKSIIHNIDPITKLLTFILIIISMFVSQEPELLIITFGFIFIISLFSKLRIKSYVNIFIFIIPFFILMFLLYWIIIPPTEALILVSQMSLRLYLFILLSIIYTSTTKEIDIAYSIECLISPLRFIKVPTYEISIMIMLAIRFIPLLFEDLKKIMIAQTSRGINVVNGNFLTKIKGIKNSLLPMFILAFKRSDEVALAMTIRGYEIGKKRTRFKETKFGLLEFFALLLTFFLLISLILMTQGIIPKWEF